MIWLHTGCRHSGEWDARLEAALARAGFEVRRCGVWSIDRSSIRPGDCLVGRFDQSCRAVKGIYPDLAAAFGGRVWPEPLAVDLYDDKLAQMRLLEAQGAPIPRWGYVVAASGVDAVVASVGGFPVVHKKREGASSKHVGLAGASGQVPAPCLVQEFCRGNEGDLRVVFAGGRVAGFHRKNRPGDFRASGSGDISPAAVPGEVAGAVRAVCRTGGFVSMCFDFVRDNGGRWVVLEMSYTYALLPVVEYCGFDPAEAIAAGLRRRWLVCPL